MTDPTKTCATCDLFRVGIGQPNGTCHVGPPGNSVHNGFPQVAPGDWCAKGATANVQWLPDPRPITIEFADRGAELQERMLTAMKEAQSESERWFGRVIQLASRPLWQRICNTVPWEGGK